MAIFPLKRINNGSLLGELETTVGIAEDDLETILEKLFGLNFEKTLFSMIEPFKVVTWGDVRWESLYDLNMDASHVRGRNWRTEDAVRDILQNALDANDEAGKPFKPEKNIVHLGTRTLVIDNGPGMPVNAFTFGGTKEGPCLRGGFGEGLKLAVGTLILRTNEPVVFITRDGTVMVADFFTATGNIGRGIVIASNDRWLGVIIGRLRKPILRKMLKKMDFGTIAVLPVSPQMVEKLIPHGKTIFSTKMPPTPKGNNCLKDYRIIEEEPPSIYIGGLLFHPSALDAMFLYKKSVYSYDLWANPYTGEIESSRNNYTLGGADRMAVKFYMLWADFFKKEPQKAVRAMAKIINAGLKRYTTPHGSLYVLDRDRGPGELSVSPSFVDEKTKEIISELVTRAIEQATGYSRDELALLSISPNETNRVGEVIYNTGRTPLIYNASLPTPRIEDMTSVLTRSAIELARNEKGLMAYDGTLAHEIIKIMARWVALHANASPNRVDIHVGQCITTNRYSSIVCGTSTVVEKIARITVGVIDTFGSPRKTEDIIETLLHEMAHALPFLQKGIPSTVSDVSADFERALGAMATLMMLHGKDILNHSLSLDAKHSTLPVKVRMEIEKALNVHPTIPDADYPLVVGFTNRGLYSIKPFRAHIPGARLTPENLGKAMPVLVATKSSPQTILRILELSAGLEVAQSTIEKARVTALRYGDTRIVATMVREDDGPVVRVYRDDEKTIELKGGLKEITEKLEDMLIDTYNNATTGTPVKKGPTKKPNRNKKGGVDLTRWLR